MSVTSWNDFIVQEFLNIMTMRKFFIATVAATFLFAAITKAQGILRQECQAPLQQYLRLSVFQQSR